MITVKLLTQKSIPLLRHQDEKQDTNDSSILVVEPYNHLKRQQLWKWGESNCQIFTGLPVPAGGYSRWDTYLCYFNHSGVLSTTVSYWTSMMQYYFYKVSFSLCTFTLILQAHCCMHAGCLTSLTDSSYDRTVSMPF